jgi:hypothetical protein
VIKKTAREASSFDSSSFSKDSFERDESPDCKCFFRLKPRKFAEDDGANG